MDLDSPGQALPQAGPRTVAAAPPPQSPGFSWIIICEAVVVGSPFPQQRQERKPVTPAGGPRASLGVP